MVLRHSGRGVSLGRRGVSREPRQYQTDLARLAIDSGMELVIGHHPHIMQGVETYKGGLILYSLGELRLRFYGVAHGKRSF